MKKATKSSSTRKDSKQKKQKQNISEDSKNLKPAINKSIHPIGAFLKKFRSEYLKESGSKFAKKIGLHPQTLYRFERECSGNFMLSLNQIQKLVSVIYSSKLEFFFEFISLLSNKKITFLTDYIKTDLQQEMETQSSNFPEESWIISDHLGENLIANFLTTTIKSIRAGMRLICFLPVYAIGEFVSFRDKFLNSAKNLSIQETEIINTFREKVMAIQIPDFLIIPMKIDNPRKFDKRSAKMPIGVIEKAFFVTPDATRLSRIVAELAPIVEFFESSSNNNKECNLGVLRGTYKLLYPDSQYQE